MCVASLQNPYVTFVINVSLCIYIMLSQHLDYMSLLGWISMSHCFYRLIMIIIMATVITSYHVLRITSGSCGRS